MAIQGAIRKAAVKLGCVGAGVLMLSPVLGCREQQSSEDTLTADVPLHLAAHLEEALVEGARKGRPYINR
jgi:hypothetical protein